MLGWHRSHRLAKNSFPTEDRTSVASCSSKLAVVGPGNMLMKYALLDFQCRIHKGSPIIPNLSRVNPIPSILVLIPIPLWFILILSSHPHLGLHKGIFPVGVSDKILKALLPPFILATWSAHLNLLDLITLTILGEWYKLWSSSFWSHLHSPFASGSCFQKPFSCVPSLM